MKKLSAIIIIILFFGCSKEDECNCYYSEELNQYVPDERFEQSVIENGMTQERLDAIAAECRLKGC